MHDLATLNRMNREAYFRAVDEFIRKIHQWLDPMALADLQKESPARHRRLLAAVRRVARKPRRPAARSRIARYAVVPNAYPLRLQSLAG